jgi:hypothetical protein
LGLIIKRIVQWPEFALGHRFRDDERVLPHHINVLLNGRRQPGGVLVRDAVAFFPELLEHGVHIDRVPEHDDVDDEAQGAELVAATIGREFDSLRHIMDDISKRVLDALQGADFWVALFCLALGLMYCRWVGTKKEEQKVLRSQIGGVLALALLAAAAMLVNHFFFQRELVFSKNLIGILVMRMADDDAHNSLQGELVSTLNKELQKDPIGKQIEVHAGLETIDENNGLSAAHEHARAIGQPVNAKLVIWGRKIADKKLYPRITLVNPPKAWSATSERTYDAVKIDEVRLPEELVDEPFYLIHFAAGYSHFDQAN